MGRICNSKRWATPFIIVSHQPQHKLVSIEHALMPPLANMNTVTLSENVNHSCLGVWGVACIKYVALSSISECVCMYAQASIASYPGPSQLFNVAC